jgi:hypothetical protein
MLVLLLAAVPIRVGLEQVRLTLMDSKNKGRLQAMNTYLKENTMKIVPASLIVENEMQLEPISWQQMQILILLIPRPLPMPAPAANYLNACSEIAISAMYLTPFDLPSQNHIAAEDRSTRW